MNRDIRLLMPEGWHIETEQYLDEMQEEITHIEAHLFDGKGNDMGLADITAGDMPEDETAYDQAFANYADMVGFSSDDEGQDPISSFSFNGRKAYGFEAEDESGAYVFFLAQEPKKGLLTIVVTMGPDRETALEYQRLVERGLRIK